MNTKTVDKLKECVKILGTLLDEEETKDDGTMVLHFFDQMLLQMQKVTNPDDLAQQESVTAQHNDGCGCGDCIPGTGPVPGAPRSEVSADNVSVHNDGCGCGDCIPGTGPVPGTPRTDPQKVGGRAPVGEHAATDLTPLDKECDCGKNPAGSRCNNACRESEIKATGTIENYLKFLGGDEEDEEDLSEVVESVNSFVDEQLWGPRTRSSNH